MVRDKKGTRCVLLSHMIKVNEETEKEKDRGHVMVTRPNRAEKEAQCQNKPHQQG
jgi:hypothetical protein